MKKIILPLVLGNLMASTVCFAVNDFSKIFCSAQDGVLRQSNDLTEFNINNQEDASGSATHGDYIYSVTNVYGDYFYEDAQGNERHEGLIQMKIKDKVTGAEVDTTVYISQNISPQIKLNQPGGKYSSLSCRNN